MEQDRIQFSITRNGLFLEDRVYYDKPFETIVEIAKQRVEKLFHREELQLEVHCVENHFSASYDGIWKEYEQASEMEL